VHNRLAAQPPLGAFPRRTHIGVLPGCWSTAYAAEKQPSFYLKNLNQKIAEHLTTADVQGTDLATILNDIKQRAEETRRF
jgi:hypothetical protein